jgi:hypothetical protein
MQIFISYAHEDASLAHLLAYSLHKIGKFTCVYDRNLRPGRKFDEDLREMISNADLVLVLLTDNALKSPWVNQEIGYATALRRSVYPLAIQAGVEPNGMIKMCQMCSLLDWGDFEGTMDRLMEALRIGGLEKAFAGRSRTNDMNFDSTYTRARFLVERLSQISQGPAKNRLICQQAAFSIFAVSDDEEYRLAGEHPPAYMNLLLQERAATEKIVLAPLHEYRLILWPVRHYSAVYQALRFQNLLDWLDKIANQKNIEIRCGEFPEPKNRLIVAGEFVLDGHKVQPSAGFGYSEARFKQERIDEALEEFDITWNKLKQTKPQAIQQLKEMHAATCLSGEAAENSLTPV